MFCNLLFNFITICKNSVCNMRDNNSNTSDNSGSETDLPGFCTLKPFEMEPRKIVSDSSYTQQHVCRCSSK